MKSTIIIDPETVSVDGVIYKKIENQKPETVVVAGLTWDVENLTDDLCAFYEANGRAAVAGKRLPTPEEWVKLAKCPHVWDSYLKGMWFADDKCDLKNPYKSLFLPAVGYHSVNGFLYNQGIYGYYWSSTVYGSNAYGDYSVFGSDFIYPSNYSNWLNRFSVRCVRL